VADTDPKPATVPGVRGGPGSASSAHPTDAIPLPAHGFETLDEVSLGDLASVSAADMITHVAVLLLRSSAEKLGLAPDGEPYLDLDEARRLITALAGLLAASQDSLGVHREPLQDGLTSVQAAFRATSRYPDEPGQGPGET
jgi:hypothetical protein